jgi:hypothetical protein
MYVAIKKKRMHADGLLGWWCCRASASAPAAASEAFLHRVHQHRTEHSVNLRRIEKLLDEEKSTELRPPSLFVCEITLAERMKVEGLVLFQGSSYLNYYSRILGAISSTCKSRHVQISLCRSN